MKFLWYLTPSPNPWALLVQLSNKSDCNKEDYRWRTFYIILLLMQILFKINIYYVITGNNNCCHRKIMSNLLKERKKDPAYRRQSISRPMRIIALLVWQNLQKKLKKIVRRFYTLYEQTFYNVRPLLSITFPQWFRISKKFGHWTLGSGSKKTIKRSEKVWRTNTKTNTQTHKRTYGHFDL